MTAADEINQLIEPSIHNSQLIEPSNLHIRPVSPPLLT